MEQITVRIPAGASDEMTREIISRHLRSIIEDRERQLMSFLGYEQYEQYDEDEQLHMALQISAREAPTTMRPSTEDSVNTCPVKRVGRNKAKSLDPCTICMCKFHGNSKYRELPCGHKFHPKCVDKWLLHEDGRCPNCNQRV